MVMELIRFLDSSRTLTFLPPVFNTLTTCSWPLFLAVLCLVSYSHCLVVSVLPFIYLHNIPV